MNSRAVYCSRLYGMYLLDGLNQKFQYHNFFKQYWRYIFVSIQNFFFWDFFLYENLQFWTILRCYKKCVTEKRTYVNKVCNLSNRYVLTGFWSIPYNKLPWISAWKIFYFCGPKIEVKEWSWNLKKWDCIWKSRLCEIFQIICPKNLQLYMKLPAWNILSGYFVMRLLIRIVKWDRLIF